MNNVPKISIITPVYNRGELLRQTIKSVLSQSYKNFEYLIIDDCSYENIKKIETFIKSDLSSMSNTAKKKAVMYDIGLAVKKYQTLISMSINKD